MSAALQLSARTVEFMRRKDEPQTMRTVIVQLLLLPAVSEDAHNGSYKGILTFALTQEGKSYGSSKTFFVSPVPPRLTATQVAYAILDELEEAGQIPPGCPAIAVPVVEISPLYAEEILSAFRTETENLLKKKELEMLEQMWNLPSE